MPKLNNFYYVSPSAPDLKREQRGRPTRVAPSNHMEATLRTLMRLATKELDYAIETQSYDYWVRYSATVQEAANATLTYLEAKYPRPETPASAPSAEMVYGQGEQ